MKQVHKEQSEPMVQMTMERREDLADQIKELEANNAALREQVCELYNDNLRLRKLIPAALTAEGERMGVYESKEGGA